MKYIDLHCDALTFGGVSAVSKEELAAGGCFLQCFAAFMRQGEGFARALALCERFARMCAEEGYLPAGEGCKAGEINALLTVEGGEAIEGSLSKLEELRACGVGMMTLTWNRPNEIGSPNGTDGGLTAFGRDCVARMAELGMLADVSHGSDRLAEDVARICAERGTPFVASHSNAREVFSHPRNLTDRTIRLVAESGGVVGLCFAEKFLSADGSAEGQRAALLAHARHVIAVGGEDAPAIGSDFDGAPPNPYVPTAAGMPRFLEDLAREFGSALAEKIAFRNALRTMRSVNLF